MPEQSKARLLVALRFPLRKRLRQSLILPGLVAALAGLRPEPAQGWGSTVSAPYFFQSVATHQFIAETAYAALTNDPAFYPGALPTLPDLLAWAGMTIGQTFVSTGVGPDVPGNSRYSDHWYNPRNRQGRGPDAVQTNALGAVMSERRDAKMVDWSAHYIADMSTPVHVYGAMRGEVLKILDKTPLGKPVLLPLDITGPADTNRDWRVEVGRFHAAFLADPHVDFSDPWYYDSAIPL